MAEVKKYDKEIIILLFGVFLVMTGLGITLPVLPFYIEKLVSPDAISAKTVSLQVGLITGSFPLAQFLFSPFLGSLSDRIGRRPLILSGILGFSISTFIFSFGGSMVLLYVSRLIAGIFAAGFVTASAAYIADKTSQEKRGKNMALLGSVAGLGVVAGPLIGYLLSNIDVILDLSIARITLDKFSSPFVISSALAMVVFFMYVFLLPESNKRNQTATNKTASAPIPVFNSNWRSLNRTFMLLLALSFMSQLSLSMFEGTFALHSQRFFAFGPQQMSIVFILCGSLMGILQLGPVAWLIEKKGEKSLLPFGFFFLSIGIFMITTSKEMTWILLFVAFISIGMALLSPSLASLVTKDSDKEHGASLGIFSSVNSLGQVAGVFIGGIVMIWYDHLAYWIISLILILLAIVVVPKTRLSLLKA